MAHHHSLGLHSTVGEVLYYVATLGERWVALLAWAAVAFTSRPRDRGVGWDLALKARRLHPVAHNVRFLVVFGGLDSDGQKKFRTRSILPETHLPNLASKMLALNLRRRSADWQGRLGYPNLLAESFMDPGRFAVSADWNSPGRGG